LRGIVACNRGVLLLPDSSADGRRRPTLARYVAGRVADLRRHHGISQQALAEQVGVNRSTITRFESGETSDPPLSLIERLAVALGVPARDLMPPPTPGAPTRRTSVGRVARGISAIHELTAASEQERESGPVGLAG
jgi:transcriptional regulator with XRE-family HTH domain